MNSFDTDMVILIHIKQNLMWEILGTPDELQYRGGIEIKSGEHVLDVRTLGLNPNRCGGYIVAKNMRTYYLKFGTIGKCGSIEEEDLVISELEPEITTAVKQYFRQDERRSLWATICGY